MPNLPLLTPTDDQLTWQQRRVGLFFHFGINTFFAQEWSDGTLPGEPASTRPSCDADQWVRSPPPPGPAYVILTAKHHDGFCLWPTATTDYAVASSPWRGGQGDVVARVRPRLPADGLTVGLYLSPWDRNADLLRRPARTTSSTEPSCTELCTRYGELVELWFDGAGSEGVRTTGPAIMDVVRRPASREAMVFNMGEPDHPLGRQRGRPRRRPGRVRGQPHPVQQLHRGDQRPDRRRSTCRPSATSRSAAAGSGPSTTSRRPSSTCSRSTTARSGSARTCCSTSRPTARAGSTRPMRRSSGRSGRRWTGASVRR